MRIIWIILAIALSVLLLYVGLGTINPLSAAAQKTPQELQQQIDSASARIQQIEREIQALGKDLIETSEQRATLEQALRAIETERQALIKELDLTRAKIERTDASIQNLNQEILTKEEKIDIQKKGIRKSIQDINRYDDYTIFEFLLGGSEMTTFWREVDQLISLQRGARDQILSLEDLQKNLQQDISVRNSEKEELISLQEEIEAQKQLVENSKKEQETLVTETKNQESAYRQQLATKEAQRKAFESEIREYESQLQFFSNPNALPPRGSAPLSWPLDDIVVTQQFGAKTGPHRTYVNGHSGTDFRARTPVKVYAMADGIVMGTGDTDLSCKGVSFGRWITILHDNNLVSTSAHLSLINVKSGDRVTRGQVIGYTGNTGRSTAPHLHISLYAGIDAEGNNPVNVLPKPSISCKGAILTQPTAPTEAYLNPLDYLPPASRGMFKEGVFDQV